MPIPLFLTAGASVEFEADTPEYGSADSYTGLLELINGSAKISLSSASTLGETHTFTAATTVSDDWLAGRYNWRLSAVKTGEKWPIAEGEIEIRPDIAAATTLDARSHVRKVIDSIEAVIERRATREDLEMTVPGGDGGGITLKKVPLADLMKDRKSVV